MNAAHTDEEFKQEHDNTVEVHPDAVPKLQSVAILMLIAVPIAVLFV